MKKVYRDTLCLLVLMLASCSQPTVSGDVIPNADPSPSQSVDEYFVSEPSARWLADACLPGEGVSLVATDVIAATRSAAVDQLPAYYIYNGTAGGFMIISASEQAYPVLGYSDKGSIDLSDLPDGLRYLLEGYRSEIEEERSTARPPQAAVVRVRRELESLFRAEQPAGEVVVAPLLGDINWNQSPYYNALAPNSQVPIGCVATATTQIMRYWKYPARAVGFHQYTSPVFGVLSFDFNHTFDWDRMPAEPLEQPNDEIAILCYGVAVAINMNFDYSFNGGSGAVHADVPGALYRHYGYPKSVTRIARADFASDRWLDILRGELDAHRPVQYGGSGSGGGHSFVLDGYDTAGLFHVNWGWGGMSNGWFRIDALDPDELGTGGGAGGFNKYQDMIIGFAPPAQITGDNNDVVPEENNDTNTPILDNGVVYKEVFVFNPLDFYIRYTRFAQMETVSRGAGVAQYLTKKVDVPAGALLDYTIELEANASDVQPVIAIYIDYNDDGQFDTSSSSRERVYVTPSGEVQLSHSATYTIPADSPKGLHRMRVKASHRGERNPNMSALTGEVEDYYINIL